MPIAPAQTVGVLIDFNEPLNNKGQQIYSEKALFSQLQFDNNEKQSQEIYNHNQQIFNNLQIDFNDDTQENNYSPMDKNVINLIIIITHSKNMFLIFIFSKCKTRTM